MKNYTSKDIDKLIAEAKAIEKRLAPQWCRMAFDKYVQEFRLDLEKLKSKVSDDRILFYVKNELYLKLVTSANNVLAQSADYDLVANHIKRGLEAVSQEFFLVITLNTR